MSFILLFTLTHEFVIYLRKYKGAGGGGGFQQLIWNEHYIIRLCRLGEIMEIVPQKCSLEGMCSPKLFFSVVVLIFTNYK